MPTKSELVKEICDQRGYDYEKMSKYFEGLSSNVTEFPSKQDWLDLHDAVAKKGYKIVDAKLATAKPEDFAGIPTPRAWDAATKALVNRPTTMFNLCREVDMNATKRETFTNCHGVEIDAKTGLRADSDGLVDFSNVKMRDLLR